MFHYAASELLFRSGRSLVTTISIAMAVLAAIVLTSLAASYARALRVPIETVGADVIVQQQGDIPPKLEGLVFPHPNALIPADIVTQIKSIPGVISLTRGVYSNTFMALPLSPRSVLVLLGGAPKNVLIRVARHAGESSPLISRYTPSSKRLMLMESRASVKRPGELLLGVLQRFLRAHSVRDVMNDAEQEPLTVELHRAGVIWL